MIAFCGNIILFCWDFENIEFSCSLKKFKNELYSKKLLVVSQLKELNQVGPESK